MEKTNVNEQPKTQAQLIDEKNLLADEASKKKKRNTTPIVLYAETMPAEEQNFTTTVSHAEKLLNYQDKRGGKGLWVIAKDQPFKYENGTIRSADNK